MKVFHSNRYGFGLAMLFAAALWAAIMAGCGEEAATNPGDEDAADTDPIEDSIEDTAPEYDVNATGLINTSPADELGFGAVAIYSDVQKTLVISNVGEGPLYIQGLTVLGDTAGEFTFPAFSEVNGGFQKFTIVPGGSYPLTINYSPVDTESDRVTLIISSNAENAPAKQVSLYSQYKGSTTLKIYRPCSDAELTDADTTACVIGAAELTEIIADKNEEYLYYIGNTPADVRLSGSFTICNIVPDPDDSNKAIELTGVTMRSSSASVFSYPSETEARLPTNAKPVYLPPDRTPTAANCFTAYVEYQPDEATFPGEYHTVTINISNDADDPGKSPLQLVVQGTASDSVLTITPTPVNFGTVFVGTPKTLSVVIANPTAAPVTISKVDMLKDLYFHLEFPTEVGNPPWTLQGMDAVTINAIFEPTPDQLGLLDDQIRVFINVTGADPIRATTKGTARLPNKAPVARIALEDGGPDVNQPIAAETCVGSHCTDFYFVGSVSYDPDRADIMSNGITKYHWTFTKPENSTAKLWPLDYDQPPYNATAVNIYNGWLDKGGDYIISLQVEDADGLLSENTKRVYISTLTFQSLAIEMTLDKSCTGRMDANLQLIAPNQAVCSAAHKNASGTCTSMASYGEAVVTSSTAACSSSRIEAISYIPAPDVSGTFRVRVLFVEDCQWDWPLNIPIVDCIITGNTTATLKFYVDGVQKWTRTASLTEKTQTVDWTMELSAGGGFHEPTP